MEEKIYTIPVTEAFRKKDGCPLCRLKRELNETECGLIMGASMMEPDVRIQTNEQGFCAKHYEKLFSMKNNRKDPEEERRWREERAKQTFLDYPEEGYGLDDDPVLDELMFLDIMEGDD